jgi:arylsulfatase A-like enzyme
MITHHSHLNKTLGLVSLAAGVAALPLAAKPVAKMQHPNILLIVADDLGWTDLGCQGSKYYETPNIDRLAREGMRFTSAYTCPNCAPTRACLMTGQYAPRTGIYTVRTGNRGNAWDRKLDAPKNNTSLPLTNPTLPEMLHGSKYTTGIAGKWHLGSDLEHRPSSRGFESAIWWQGNGHINFKTIPVIEQKGQWLTDFLADQGIAFMRRAHQEKKPFLLVITHFAVHEPSQAPEDIIAKYEAKPPAGGHKNPTYAAMIQKLDESVGRVVREIDELGIGDNTLVIFTSDNGGVVREKSYKTDNTPLRGGKGMHYEGGIRVPFIARWPGTIKPGTACDTPIAAIDFAPTVLDLTRQPLASGAVIDGRSYLPLLKGLASKELSERALYWHCPGYLEATGNNAGWRSTPGGVIREGSWKLIENFESNTIELYNLDKDLPETTDLSKQEPKIAASLVNKLRQWRKDLKAPMPAPNPDYQNPAAAKKKKKGAGAKGRTGIKNEED